MKIKDKPSMCIVTTDRGQQKAKFKGPKDVLYFCINQGLDSRSPPTIMCPMYCWKTKVCC